MATNTYVALNKVTVSGTSTTSVTLSAISGAYTDLRLIISSQNQNSTNQPYIQFNADTGTGTTNYSTTSLRGDGSSGASSRHTSNVGWYPVPGPGVGPTGNFQPWLVDIMNYSNITTFKSGISRFNNAASIVSANAHTWRSTAAITSITITAEAGAGYLVPGSTFSLYGIAAQVNPAAKATGGTISYGMDGYTYHTFASSGTFTPSVALTNVDYLVVAGGGGGGSRFSGGGGAGGLRCTVGTTGGGGSLESKLSLTAQAYTVTIGAGGGLETSGSNSAFSTITSTGGGRGGTFGGFNGGSGGSGGGGSASLESAGFGQGGAGTSGQGFAGGSGDPNIRAGGGGGGAGAIGQSYVNSSNPGNGGIGALVSDFSSATGTGVSNRFAGGGGGGAIVNGDTATAGTGGLGGGGNGGQNGGNGGNGTTNTGGGGGGFGQSAAAGSGGSGIVIVRYVS
jgi:hypothetical protein